MNHVMASEIVVVQLVHESSTTKIDQTVINTIAPFSGFSLYNFDTPVFCLPSVVQHLSPFGRLLTSQARDHLV